MGVGAIGVETSLHLLSSGLECAEISGRYVYLSLGSWGNSWRIKDFHEHVLLSAGF